MRAIGADGLALLGLDIQQRSDSFVVEVDRTGSGDWVNLRDYEGVDWCDSVEWEDSEENPTTSADIMLRRSFDDMSLSPLMAQSKLNAGGTLIWPKRKIRIKVSNLSRGEFASSGGGLVFDGRIDVIEWNSDPMRLTCRDLGGDLQDAFIETQKVYGTAGGKNIEDVIQDILDDANTNGWLANAVTLYSPNGTGGTPFNAGDSPGFAIKEYKQGKESVMDAIQKLARLIGYQCKYRWQSNTSGYELQLYPPNREVNAQGSLTLTGTPSATETFVVNSTTFTARASGATTDEFNIGATALATCTNIAAMLNSDSESSNVNAWVDDDGANPKVVIEWQTAGVTGNAVTFTESLSNATADGGGTLGGTQSGADITVDRTFGPTQYWEPETMSIDVQNVRNAFSLTYAAPGASSDDYTRTTVTRRNSASIAKYGRRFFGITEESNSQIDTTDEAQRMLAAAEADLAEPDADVVIPIVYFPWGESGDYYTFEADGIHFDSDQSLAVVSLRHRASPSGVRSIVRARGKPSLGVGRWMEIEARPGVAPRTDLFNDSVSAPSIEAGLGGIIVTFDDPRTQDPPIHDWAHTEVYVSTSSISPPTLGERPGGALKGKGRQTRFEINGLVPGTTYYAAYVHVDSAGNVSAMSSEVSVATAKVSHLHTNEDSTLSDLSPNPEFNVWSPPEDDKTANPPDKWTTVEDDGGNNYPEDESLWAIGGDNVYFDTTEVLTGEHSVKITNTSSGGNIRGVLSDLFPVTEGTLYSVELICKRAGNSSKMRISARWYQDDKSTFVAGGTSRTSTGSSTDWQRISGFDEAPANARYARLLVTLNETTGTHTMYADRARLSAAPVSCRVYQSSASVAVSSGSPQQVDFDSESFDNVDNFDTSADEFTAPEDGNYLVQGQAGVQSLGNGKFVQAMIYKNSSLFQLGPRNYNHSGGTDDVLSSVVSVVSLVEGDTISLYVEHDEGSNLNLIEGEDGSNLNVQKM